LKALNTTYFIDASSARGSDAFNSTLSRSGSLGKNQQPFFLATLTLAPPTLDKERWDHG
jgi:hypothetical protein